MRDEQSYEADSSASLAQGLNTFELLERRKRSRRIIYRSPAHEKCSDGCRQGSPSPTATGARAGARAGARTPGARARARASREACLFSRVV